MRYLTLALLSAATAAAVAPTASAQYYYRPPVVYTDPSYSPYYAAPTRAFYCVKACTQDTSPFIRTRSSVTAAITPPSSRGPSTGCRRPWRIPTRRERGLTR